MKDPKILLKHILQYIERIEDSSQGLSFEDFKENLDKQDAIVRRLEVIGEASCYLPDEVRGQISNIPWKSIVGMRNLLIHEYFDVSLRQVWTTIQRDLPFLKEEITNYLSK